MKDYIAFFDLDNTILNANSGKIIAHYAHKNGWLTTKDLGIGSVLSLLHRTGFIDPYKIIPIMLGWFKGISEKNFVDLSNQVFDGFIKNMIRKNASSEIKSHHDNNGHTVILSAAISYICAHVKEFLEMDDMVCTELEVIDGYFSGTSKGIYCYSQEKLNRAKQYCAGYNYSLDKSYFYTDSVSDLPLLEEVAHPMCVAPEPKLARIARKRGWTICNW